MRPSSLRALLLALAMVIQTIAGAGSVARAGVGVAGLAMTAHCATGVNEADGATDGRRHGRHQPCDSCCLCAGPPGASLIASGPALTAPRAFGLAGFVLNEAPASAAWLGQFNRARGPPADAAGA